MAIIIMLASTSFRRGIAFASACLVVVVVWRMISAHSGDRAASLAAIGVTPTEWAISALPATTITYIIAVVVGRGLWGFFRFCRKSQGKKIDSGVD